MHGGGGHLGEGALVALRCVRGDGRGRVLVRLHSFEHGSCIGKDIRGGIGLLRSFQLLRSWSSHLHIILPITAFLFVDRLFAGFSGEGSPRTRFHFKLGHEKLLGVHLGKHLGVRLQYARQIVATGALLQVFSLLGGMVADL